MTLARGGAVSTGRAFGYCTVGVAAGLLVTAAVVGSFGINRLFTGLLVGVVVGAAVTGLLFGLDSVAVTSEGVEIRRLWSRRFVPWEDVLGSRFGILDGNDPRWVLALRVSEIDGAGPTIVLMSIRPVTGPVTNAYEMRKREQIKDLLGVLALKDVMVSIHPEIAAAVREHWGVQR